MRRGWRLVLDEGAVEFLLACRAKQRRQLIRFLDELRANPYLTGDFQEYDDTDRELQVKSHREFLITFWADHATREIRIAHIETFQ